MYTEASNGLAGAVASLVYDGSGCSPLATTNVTFSYHMLGAGIGTLAVLTNEQVWWSKSGAQGSAWRSTTVHTNSASGFEFRAQKSSDPAKMAYGDVAVTDVTVSCGVLAPCSSATTAAAAPSSTSTPNVANAANSTHGTSTGSSSATATALAACNPASATEHSVSPA